jgi:chemotaxis protein CheX
MRMELIQPFISSLDTVLAEMMEQPAKIIDLTMEEEGYRRKGLAASVAFSGQIEGQVILDMDPAAAVHVASYLSGEEVSTAESIVPETVCELANMVIGNAVTLLNDRGFQFKVSPPEILNDGQLEKAGFDSEATVLSFETPKGTVYLNISMEYHTRRTRDRLPVPVP